MALIYNATFDKNTRKLSFEDRAGNEIYSFIVPERSPVDKITKPLTFKATQDGSTVTLRKNGSPTGDFQTSTDGGNTWTDYTIGTAIALNTGDEVSFRSKADRTSAQTYNAYFYFIMEGKIEAWHNVMSLYRTSDLATYNTVVDYAFYRIFYGCTSLTKAPVLPATTLSKYCYRGMFNGCTSLTEAPELPATTLTEYCYADMFMGCTSLANAPALPATTLYRYCYMGMFNGCTSLTKAPVLPVTTLAPSCYASMFGGCTSLVEAPVLPATTLASGCYQYMFKSCASMTKAPELPATTLADYCYLEMFNGCSSLNEVRCNMPSSYSSSNISSTYAENWLLNVASTGTFYTNADANWPLLSASGIPEGWTRVNFDDITKPLTFKATQDGSTIYLQKNNQTPGSFQTSTDGGNTWVDYTISRKITLNIGDEVSFRAKEDRTPDPGSPVSSGYFQFRMTGKIEAWNNVMSMIRTNDFATYESVIKSGFRRLFYKCTSLTKAPVLPATILADSCYYEMFSGCTSLTKTPELPATTLANYCYQDMFDGCTSLTKAPVLPATRLAPSCYASMFGGCTSLTKAPVLPVTTLENGCYQTMFMGCTSLTEAPELPATILNSYCYSGMFSGCTSLTKSPELPATTLTERCYANMFKGCTSLTKAPVLPATTLANYCYEYMFSGCTSLAEAPELPATTLTTGCYQYMFKGCTSLAKAPELPATTLTQGCYLEMFNGCSSLNEVRCNIPSSYTSSQISSYASNWLSNVSSTGTFYTNSDANWPSGASGIPEGWTRVPEVTPAVDGIRKPLTFKATQDGSSVRLTKNGSPDGSFQTSRDGGNTWTDYTLGTYINLNTGREVSFRAKADRTSGQTVQDYFYFEMTGKIEAWHNVMSLYRTNDFATYSKMVSHAFYKLFLNCTSLTKAPKLPVTTLAHSCYQYMFNGCTSLTKAPALPSTTLAVQCYYSMFYGCTSLTEAPALPATTLAGSCYQYMFNGCTSLTKTPALSATTLADHCYQEMFRNCSNLNEVRCKMSSSYSSNAISTYAPYWLSGVSSKGTFYTNADANWPSGDDGIPQTWTRVNT